MIFTADDHRAANAQILDSNGFNICEYYYVRWYNTITQVAGVMKFTKGENKKIVLMPDGLGGFDMDFIHFPGSKLVFK